MYVCVYVCMYVCMYEWKQVIMRSYNHNTKGALDAGIDTALVFVDADPSLSFKTYAEKICTNTIDKVTIICIYMCNYI